MPRRKQTCPMRMKYDGKELPEGQLPPTGENGENVELREGEEGEEDSQSDSNATEGEDEEQTEGEEETDKKTEKKKRTHSSDSKSPGASSTTTSPTHPASSSSPLPPTLSPQGPPPPVSEQQSILDRLASFTNGTSGKPPVYSNTTNILTAAAAATTEESAISKLSQFVKDPGKLLSSKPEVVAPPPSVSGTSTGPVRIPRSVKVPTPPSLPAAYQQYIAAAAAAAAAATYMLPPTSAASPTLSDPDLPLDLSVKTKGLDLSIKSPKTSNASASSSTSSSSSSKYISPPPPSKYRSKESNGSSLASLEQKFGGNSFPFDARGGNSMKSQLYRHPLMPAFGGNLYTSALFNTQTLASTDLIYQAEKYYQPPTSMHHSPSYHKHSSPRREGREGREGSARGAESSSRPSPNKSHHPTRTTNKTSTPSPSTPSRNSDNGKASPKNSIAPTASSTGATSTSTVNSTSTTSTAALVTSTEAGGGAGGGAASPSGKDKRHTTLLCKCGKDYYNLYDLTLHLRETGHSPNDKGGVQPEYPKLVRGQDMWLNQGSEQTRQILRCMQCGESFKSLPELTVHMIETKHYTNIVGADTSAAAGASGPIHNSITVTPSRKTPTKPVIAYSDSGSDELDVFRCQVCEIGFENMDGLSAHMITSGHHKRPVIIQPESPRSPLASSSPKPRAASPMSLSLMEYKYKLARLAAAHGAAAVAAAAVGAEGASPRRDTSSPGSDFLAEISKITCETCGDRIDMGRFVDHVRVCVGKQSSLKYSKTNGVDATSSAGSPHSQTNTPPPPSQTPKKRKLDEDENDSHDSKDEIEVKSVKPGSIKKERNRSAEADSYNHQPIPINPNLLLPPPVSSASSSASTSEASALKAMESFIERSFTSASSHLRNRYFPFKGPIRGSYMMNQGHHQEGQGRSEPPKPPREEHSSRYSSKYLPPLYVNPDSTTTSVSSPLPAAPPPSLYKSEQHTTESKAVKRKLSSSDQVSSPSTPPMKIKKEKVEGPPSPKPHTPSPPVSTASSEAHTPPTMNKYLQEDESPKSNSPNRSASASALESLQGLVYGKSFNAEHPLDSLQKLLHTPQQQVIGGTGRHTPGENTHSKMNGSLVNNNINPRRNTPPVNATASVTLLPSSMGSLGSPGQQHRGSPHHRASPAPNPSSHRHGSPYLHRDRGTGSPHHRGSPYHSTTPSTTAASPSPPNSHHPQQPGGGVHHRASPVSPARPATASPHAPPPTNATSPEAHPHPPPRSDGEDDTDVREQAGEGGELECPGCKRLFVSRGSYRYHVSRCHSTTTTTISNNTKPQQSPPTPPSPQHSPQTTEPTSRSSPAKQQQPYVYLPLDHTAKFNKYYEMANELANKTK